MTLVARSTETSGRDAAPRRHTLWRSARPPRSVQARGAGGSGALDPAWCRYSHSHLWQVGCRRTLARSLRSACHPTAHLVPTKQISSRLIWRPLQGHPDGVGDAVPAFQRLSPAWKVMLLSDGSVTRHLELLLNTPVEVDCLEMREIGSSAGALPKEVSLVEGPHLQRQVYLRNPANGRALVYAASWWNARTVREYLQDESKPIWASLSQSRTELYRDIRTVYFGECPDLSAAFDAPGPYWGRDYIFWNQGKPLTVIHEVFSTGLSQYLGRPD